MWIDGNRKKAESLWNGKQRSHSKPKGTNRKIKWSEEWKEGKRHEKNEKKNRKEWKEK